MGNVGSGGSYEGEPEVSESLKIFGAGLKAFREEAGLTQERFAERTGYSTHYIAKIEQGQRFPRQEFLERAKEVLGPVAGRVLGSTARSLTRRAALAQRFQHWAAIEEDAIALDAYECRAVPGLLQPEPYLRALFNLRLPPLSEERIERQVAGRLARQAVLDERPSTAFSFVIEQALLERRVGGPQVTRALMDRLLELSSRRNVDIQVMPLLVPEHAGAEGPLYLAQTPDHRWIGYSEAQLSSNLLTSPEAVGILLQRYGKLRSLALGPGATVKLLEQMRGDL